MRHSEQFAIFWKDWIIQKSTVKENRNNMSIHNAKSGWDDDIWTITEDVTDEMTYLLKAILDSIFWAQNAIILDT